MGNTRKPNGQSERKHLCVKGSNCPARRGGEARQDFGVKLSDRAPRLPEDRFYHAASASPFLLGLS